MGFARNALTRDAFLGGRVHAWQPRDGYRAATDPVLLAAAVEARPGQSVLELGCGAGVASLCLSARVPDLTLTGVERQADYADLAHRNLGDSARIVTADLAALPDSLRQQHFDHVIANPPYYRAGAGTPAGDTGREAALREETPLTDWVEVAARRLAPKGWLTMIQAADRLPDMMAAMVPRLGSLMLRPLVPRIGRPAGRVLLRGRKGGRAPFVLLPPLILHDGAKHQEDGDDFSQAAQGILREAAALPWV
ncbi:tRNA1(Val) (adenine(37)-N6)-methyltransferase [Nioella nitratireducens]|uniref:tRNA1(Val) (adenine(37)-N6)-methyltransferase n=1 Tax=Nioella nitratireducens TaxID=1287720 RepID=UPI0008FD2819|nr:methyltransferase [Nioella nitratireducens]